MIPRANDYTRMFSSAGRRAAPEPAESPRRDKYARAAGDVTLRDHATGDVTLRDRSLGDVTLRDRATTDRTDRLSASDYYTVSEDVTPQPFKGTNLLIFFA